METRVNHPKLSASLALAPGNLEARNTKLSRIIGDEAVLKGHSQLSEGCTQLC